MDMLCFYNYESIHDETLKRITLSIVDSCKTVTGNMFKIAALLARVEKDDLLINEDFASVIEYAKKCFGFEKTTTYNLLKIGHDFIKETEDGNVETVLTYLNDDYNVSQVIKMLPLGIDKAKELTHDGVITSDMSCRQIERIVKQNLKRMQPEDDPEEVDEEIEDDPKDKDQSEPERIERCELCEYYRRLKHNFIVGKGFEESHACVVFLNIEKCPEDDQWVQEVDPRDMCEYFTERSY